MRVYTRDCVKSSYRSKDRSLRQLLHWDAYPVGAAEGCDLLTLKQHDSNQHRHLQQFQQRPGRIAGRAA